MTFKTIIDYVDKVSPNAFGTDEKLLWLGEVEAMVKSEIYGEETNGSVTVTESDVPIVSAPYSAIYAYYIFSMMDYLTSDFDRYGVSSELFEKSMNLYAKYCLRCRGK